MSSTSTSGPRSAGHTRMFSNESSSIGVLAVAGQLRADCRSQLPEFLAGSVEVPGLASRLRDSVRSQGAGGRTVRGTETQLRHHVHNLRPQSYTQPGYGFSQVGGGDGRPGKQ